MSPAPDGLLSSHWHAPGHVDGRTYDAYEAVLTEGTERQLYFKVTDWLAHAIEP